MGGFGSSLEIFLCFNYLYGWMVYFGIVCDYFLVYLCVMIYQLGSLVRIWLNSVFDLVEEQVWEDGD